MKLLTCLLAVALWCSAAACVSAPPADVACCCGTPLGDLEGCAHQLCLDGRNNPDNPECVCGTLEIPAQQDK